MTTSMSIPLMFNLAGVIPPEEILKTNILNHELLETFPLGAYVILSLGEFFLQLLYALSSAQSIDFAMMMMMMMTDAAAARSSIFIVTTT